MQNRDAIAITLSFFFLALSCVILWFLRVRLGITEASIQIAVLILAVLVYGVVSGRLTEFTGPGGWGAKFHEVAASPINADKLDLTDAEMQNIPKMGLQQIEQKIQSIAPGKPIVLSLTVGRSYYNADTLRDSIRALTRFPSFRFILFLTQEGTLVSYIPCQTLLGILTQSSTIMLAAPPQPGQPVGPGADLVNAVNTGDWTFVKNYVGMITKTIPDTATNWEALEAMESVGLDAIVVVDANGRPLGVAERGRITSRMLAALAWG